MSAKKKYMPLPFLSNHVKLIDTHCHLDMSAYDDDLELVIARAVEASVHRIITVGIDLDSSRRAIALAEKWQMVKATIGVHPHNAASVGDGDYQEFIKLAAHPEVVAYGEIGLDYVKNYAPVPLQQEHFNRQLKLAGDLQLPVIIHDREAHQDTMAALLKAAPFPAGGVMHCFSGNAKLAAKVVEMGFYLSIPGVVTFNKAASLQEVVRQTPLTSMVLETDGPFLAPVPNRGKRNEPAFILYTAQKVAELKGVSLDEVAFQTTTNVCTLFDL